MLDVAVHHNDVENSLQDYFSSSSPSAKIRFFDYLPHVVLTELQERLAEQDKQSSLMVLAHLEARWRTDYLKRCQNKDKDPLSRHLRKLKRKHGSEVKFEESLLTAWVAFSGIEKRLASEIKAAFKFRHWLAHGRYWEPDLGRRFDYHYIYQLAKECDSYFKYA
ncbi:hypothetical protein [Herbaspirillum autotrophicum]|uniref:hypothetical protein n=1 Tax=Herbaspirillum autotrophicum TaxID=180195 RepID=UPI0012EDEF34|nr:hypothetical protein [Herbaspirillum autotrophicum]